MLLWFGFGRDPIAGGINVDTEPAGLRPQMPVEVLCALQHTVHAHVCLCMHVCPLGMHVCAHTFMCMYTAVCDILDFAYQLSQ